MTHTQAITFILRDSIKESLTVTSLEEKPPSSEN